MPGHVLGVLQSFHSIYILALFALASGVGASEAVLPAAAAADDECSGLPPEASGECSLSALQTRGVKQVVTSQTDVVGEPLQNLSLQGSNFHEVLNTLYGNDTGLIVTMMSKSFQERSKAPGVPLWACPASGMSDGTSCKWHQGLKYASASWISKRLYGKSGVELYGCDENECQGGRLLLVYSPKTAIVGAGFPLDGETDIDGNMEGTSKEFVPPKCSAAGQACSYLKKTGSAWRACTKVAGGDMGMPYKDKFSKFFDGELEGILQPYGKNKNFTALVDTQLQMMRTHEQNQHNVFLRPCVDLGDSDPPAWCAKLNCSRITCTCGTSNFGYNEVMLRTGNPSDICDKDPDQACIEKYQRQVCKTQLPIAFAYVPGVPMSVPLNQTRLDYLEYYQGHISSLCKTTELLPVVQFDPTNSDTPFKALLKMR